MATRTFTNGGVNNLWTTIGNWNTPPVDNDAVVISTGSTCEYDGDMSNAGTWPNGIAGITVTGTLNHTSTPGSYYLKIKTGTAIGGAGTHNAGSTTFSAKHTITGGNTWTINGTSGLTLNVLGAEPTIKTILLTQTESIGATVLHVDTSVLGDIWTDGDIIHISDINQVQEDEERTIATGGIAAGTITITAGLTLAKSTGAVVTLVTRNTKFVGVSTQYILQNFASGKLIIGGGLWITNAYRIATTCTGAVINGGCFCSGASAYGFASCTDLTINGGVFVGNSYTINSCTGVIINGGTFVGNSNSVVSCVGVTMNAGLIKANTYAFNSCVGVVINGGTISNNGSGMFTCVGVIVNGGTFLSNASAFYNSSIYVSGAALTSNTYDLRRTIGSAYNQIFTSVDYEYAVLAKENIFESFIHNQVPNAYHAWTKGGVTSSQTATPPTGFTQYNETVLENASVEGWWQKEVLVVAGASTTISMCLRKTASMTYLPRCIIFDKSSIDPFASGTGITTFTMTNSIDTWEYKTYTYTNTTSADVILVLRFLGKNAAGSMLSAVSANIINVDLTTALAQIALIKAKTDNLPGDPADESLLEAAIAAIPVAPSAASVADAVLDEAGAGHTGLIPTNLDAKISSRAVAGDLMALTGTAVDLILDDPVEGTYTMREALRIMLAVLAGKANGGGTATIVFRDVNDSKDRVEATVDVNGNRSTVILDVT